ncbi:ImcF-related family protein [Cupriavidus agavae]|uniref:Type VI secretion system protein ImpL n=1 Tax=Cupriavidus agavae TaxID=1001822 RepID=A0A4Q7S8W7_9BURK|nr:ImcF-related family protein [Cupriavidus agavae]RZT42793.1 type VI secretion system protein ImpL [Cupriavidus agavae]
MTDPTRNLQALAAHRPAPAQPVTLATWGVPLLALSLFILAAAIVWFRGHDVGLPDERERISVLIWLGAVLVAVVVLHLFAVLVGAYALARRWLNHHAGAERTRRLRRDGRLQWLADELRVTLGWRWRYRLPWLLVCGDAGQVNAVAPGLKQAGVLQVDHAVLVHAAPDGIDAAQWRRQLRRLRARRPVDALVQVVPANQREAAATDQLRVRAGIESDLGWAAPVVYLHSVELPDQPPEQFDAVGAFVAASDNGAGEQAATGFREVLDTLEQRTVRQGTLLCLEPHHSRHLALISAYISAQRARIEANWQAVLASKWRRATLAGIVFAPVFPVPAAPVPMPARPDASGDLWRTARPHPSPNQPAALATTWQAICTESRRYRGRRVGVHAATVVAMLALAGVVAWTAGMVASGVRNARDIGAARQAVRDLASTADGAHRLQALDNLQQQILRYTHRIGQGAPLGTRFGLNRDAEVLNSLWAPYANASRELVVAPVVRDIEASLTSLTQLQTAGLRDETLKWALEGRATLETYLMLAQPERADAAVLGRNLAERWTTGARITPGKRADLAERFGSFYADHLQDHPHWRIATRPELVAGARQTLLEAIGQRNAADAIYQSIIAGVSHKYPNQTLASLTAGTDTRGLLRATGSVPAIYTRQAYEGYVRAAIETSAARVDVSDDWVLGDNPSADRQTGSDGQARAADLRAALAERYFADYADHWQRFMNGLQWESAATLPAVADQLKLMADARQSPVIALLKSLQYHGGAGAHRASLSEALVARAQGILGTPDNQRDNAGPAAAGRAPGGPLDPAFGPVLRLTGDTGQAGTGTGELSLQRYLDRITAVRLRLQQIAQGADGDAQALQLAQALFQGRSSDLADTQAYAQLVAASLGTGWAGMGETLFVRPVAQATQAVLQPALASLDEAWRVSIALPWNRAFASRYPFADSPNDASLPEIAHYVRPRSGLIPAFVLAELSGVLALRGDRWTPVGSGAHALRFDPRFVEFINTLQRVGTRLLLQGDPRYRFDLKPVPTPGLTSTILTIDNQTLRYYNQREAWHAMTWPASDLQQPRAMLAWQTETAGMRKNHEAEGVWAWVRMLERAEVTPIDSATVQLTFQTTADATPVGAETVDSVPAAGRAQLCYPIRYQMRSAAGQGPLEILALRHLQVPERMFLPRGTEAVAADSRRAPAI